MHCKSHTDGYQCRAKISRQFLFVFGTGDTGRIDYYQNCRRRRRRLDVVVVVVGVKQTLPFFKKISSIYQQ